MTTKKTTPPAKPAAAKVVAAPIKNRAASHPGSSAPTQKQLTTNRASPIPGQELAHDRGNDPSDLERDQRLRNDLEKDGGRSPGDRHRERLTAIEAEEDGVRDDEDENQAGRADADK